MASLAALRSGLDLVEIAEQTELARLEEALRHSEDAARGLRLAGEDESLPDTRESAHGGGSRAVSARRKGSPEDLFPKDCAGRLQNRICDDAHPLLSRSLEVTTVA